MQRRMKNMFLAIFVVAVILMAIPSSSAGIEVEEFAVSPQKLLVDDAAECYLKLTNPKTQAIKVSSVKFRFPSGLSVEPELTLDVGYIPKQSNYILPFYVEAKKAGKYTISAEISTNNGSITQSITQRINVIVEDRLPEVAFDESIRLNEINTMDLRITSPLYITNVKIEPLFDSETGIIYIDEVENSEKEKIRFLGVKQDYKFRISFYNGNNFHSFIQEVKASYIESQGVFTNVSTPYTSVYLYDVIPVSVEITNLRDDTIYNISITAESSKGEFAQRTYGIAKLDPDEVKQITLLYSPIKGGEDTINLKLIYKDSMGNLNKNSVSKSIKINSDAVLSVTGVSIETTSTRTTSSTPGGPPGIFNGGSRQGTSSSISSNALPVTQATISGDVSNNGWSEVINAYIYVDLGGESNSYFAGSIEPSEFQSFSIPAKGSARVATVKLVWMNQLGQKIETTEELNIGSTNAAFTPVQRQQTLLWMYAIPVTVVFAIVILYRRKMKNRGEYE